MLYPGIDTRNQFHEDHLFPRSILVSRKKLREYGVDEDDMSAIIDCADRAANLQLLRGPENQSKSDQLPDQWLRIQFSNEADRQGWLREYDAVGLPDDISGFLDFYQRRRARMRERLAVLLDVDLTAGPATAAPAVSSGDSGDEPDPGNEGL